MSEGVEGEVFFLGGGACPKKLCLDFETNPTVTITVLIRDDGIPVAVSTAFDFEYP